MLCVKSLAGNVRSEFAIPEMGLNGDSIAEFKNQTESVILNCENKWSDKIEIQNAITEHSDMNKITILNVITSKATGNKTIGDYVTINKIIDE